MSNPQALATECFYCGRPLDDEERENPETDTSGNTLCDDCHHDHFEFTCCRCENYEHVDHQHEVLVVFDDDLEVPPGVYRIIDMPYYTQGMIGDSWLHPRCLERLCDLPPELGGKDWDYPCGHLCRKCREEIVEKGA